MSEPIKARHTLEEFTQNWYTANNDETDELKARPMIFVATAGGGIRASHWTAAVLTSLTENDPKFANALFAISGVSGGSVGGAVYNALLNEKIACPNGDQNPPANCLQQQAKSMLSQDFLGPLVASLLFNDFLQYFIPVGIFPDRQKALEQSWETAWERTFNNSKNWFSAPFSSTWANTSIGKWSPLLLLNSTHMETGKKMIMSPFPLNPEFFLDDIDVYSLLQGRDMRLSTAAGNSARFSYVSPPGKLPDEGSFFKLWQDNGHILDGGYFENNGTLTLQALLKSLQAIKVGDKSFFEANHIKPIVILITNDNNLLCEKGAHEVINCNGDVVIQPDPPLAEPTPAITDFNGQFMQLTDNNLATETIGPLQGILNTRDGHGIAAVKNLVAWVRDCRRSPNSCNLSTSLDTQPEFFHFRFDLNNGEIPPALGWVLSKKSENLIWEKINTSKHNKAEQEKLIGILKGTATASELCCSTIGQG